MDAMTIEEGDPHHPSGEGYLELCCYQETASDPGQASIQQYHALLSSLFDFRTYSLLPSLTGDRPLIPLSTLLEGTGTAGGGGGAQTSRLSSSLRAPQVEGVSDVPSLSPSVVTRSGGGGEQLLSPVIAQPPSPSPTTASSSSSSNKGITILNMLNSFTRNSNSLATATTQQQQHQFPHPTPVPNTQTSLPTPGIVRVPRTDVPVLNADDFSRSLSLTAGSGPQSTPASKTHSIPVPPAAAIAALPDFLASPTATQQAGLSIVDMLKAAKSGGASVTPAAAVDAPPHSASSSMKTSSSHTSTSSSHTSTSSSNTSISSSSNTSTPAPAPTLTKPITIMSAAPSVAMTLSGTNSSVSTSAAALAASIAASSKPLQQQQSKPTPTPTVDPAVDPKTTRTIGSKTAHASSVPEAAIAVGPTIAADNTNASRAASEEAKKILATIQHSQASFEKQQLGLLQTMSRDLQRDLQSSQSKSADELLGRVKASVEQSFSQSHWKEEVPYPTLPSSLVSWI